jgi:hypothetical protein
MKKKIWLIPVIAAIVMILGAGAVYAAGGDKVQVFQHQFTVRVEPIEVQVVNGPQWQIYSDQTFTVTYRIVNHSPGIQEMMYNIEEIPATSLSGAVVIDYDGPAGPQKPEFYTWGKKVPVRPHQEQYLYVSLAPSPDYTGNLDVTITFDRWLGPRG